MGSNPTLSAFYFYLQAKRRIHEMRKKRPQRNTGTSLLQPYCNPLAKSRVHRVGKPVVHDGQDVTVDVQSHGYVGVAEELLH